MVYGNGWMSSGTCRLPAQPQEQQGEHQTTSNYIILTEGASYYITPIEGASYYIIPSEGASYHIKL
jgi:hypothetical protein